MQPIDIYHNSSMVLFRKVPHKIINATYLIVSFVIIVILISLFYHYPRYNYYRAYIKKDNNDYIISVVLEESDLPFIKTKTLWINQEKVKVKKVDITEPNYDNLGKVYYIVKIKAEIDDNIKIENNIVDIHLFMNRTTIAQELWKKIKKGMM